MIRIGVIGCGYWGPNLVRALSETAGASVVRVSDLRQGRLELIARRHPGIETTTHADDILSDASIDAVVIATPPDTHHRLALDALNRGKHVFVEKPLATKTAEAEQIVEMADRKRRTLLVGHLFLYHPAVVEIRSLLERGDLGTVYCISSTRCNLGPPNTNIDVLWDLAPHDISMVLHFMRDTPIEVRAYGASFTNPRYAETVFTTLRFGDGRIANIHASWLTPGKTRLMQLIGSKRVVIYDDMQQVQKVQIFEPGIDNRVNASDKDSAPLGFMPGGIWSPPLKASEPLRAECEDFVTSIQTGRSPLSNGPRALQVVRVLEAASDCLRAGGQSAFASAEFESRAAAEVAR